MFIAASFAEGRLPARTCVGVTGLAYDALIEIDLIARRTDQDALPETGTSDPCGEETQWSKGGNTGAGSSRAEAAKLGQKS